MSDEQKIQFYDKLKRAIENYEPEDKITLEFENISIVLEIVDLKPPDLNIYVTDKTNLEDKVA